MNCSVAYNMKILNFSAKKHKAGKKKKAVNLSPGKQITSEPSRHPVGKLSLALEENGEKDLWVEHLICSPPELRLCTTHSESRLLWLQTSASQESDEERIKII